MSGKYQCKGQLEWFASHNNRCNIIMNTRGQTGEVKSSTHVLSIKSNFIGSGSGISKEQKLPQEGIGY